MCLSLIAAYKVTLHALFVTVGTALSLHRMHAMLGNSAQQTCVYMCMLIVMLAGIIHLQQGCRLFTPLHQLHACQDIKSTSKPDLHVQEPKRPRKHLWQKPCLGRKPAVK